jgi:hypothetical protein
VTLDDYIMNPCFKTCDKRNRLDVLANQSEDADWLSPLSF